QETAVVALGGRVYVLGGFDGQNRVVDTVEVYDPARDRWEARRPLPVPLHHMNAAAVGSKLYVAGALAANDFRAVGVTYEYDPSADAARRLRRRRRRRPNHRGRRRGNGRRPDGVFVEAEAYDPTADAWTALPPMLAPRHGTGAAALGSKLYVPGGAIRQGFGAVATNEVLDPTF